MNIFKLLKRDSFIYGVAICLIEMCLLMVSCSDNDADRVVVMDISSQLVSTGVRPPGQAGDYVKMMECIVEGTNETFYISPHGIEGFEYVEGFKYKIKVRIINIDNPPADGNTERYELVEIISKELIN